MPENTNAIEILSSMLASVKTPEEYAALVEKLASTLPQGTVGEMLRGELVAEARKDGLDGYMAFYELLYGFKPPDHVVTEVDRILDDMKAWDGTIVFAWRGSWKTVSISLTFVAWRVGISPLKTNLLVCANDDSAEKITKAIAAIIESHPEWRRIFPNIVPDKGRWSVEGFNVVDNSISPDEWAQKRAAVIDPTFVGGGWESSRLNGKHPTGCLVMDDIHDRKNSASDRERRAVVDTVKKVILKTAVREKDRILTNVIDVGTPWHPEDASHDLKKTGQYKFVGIPAMLRVNEGDPGAVYIDGKSKGGVIYEDIAGWWKLTWPQGYGINAVISDRATLGKVAFWQMIMLDLVTARLGGIKYYGVDLTGEEKEWPINGGCDPAYTMKDRAEGTNKNSSFALGPLAKRPTGGAVLLPGVLEKCSPQQAANHIAAMQTLHSQWNGAYVENSGMGQLFIETIRALKPELIILPSDLGGIRLKGEKAARAKSKRDRIQLELAPWLENATITIANVDNPLLNAVRDGLDNFNDLEDDSPDERWDALDQLYHGVKSMPDVLARQIVEKDIRGPQTVRVNKSPLVGIGQHIGYGRR